MGEFHAEDYKMEKIKGNSSSGKLKGGNKRTSSQANQIFDKVKKLYYFFNFKNGLRV